MRNTSRIRSFGKPTNQMTDRIKCQIMLVVPASVLFRTAAVVFGGRASCQILQNKKDLSIHPYVEHSGMHPKPGFALYIH